MVAAERLINEGQGGLRGVEKESVVVTTDEAVEGCELGGRKGLDVPWRDFFVNVIGDSKQQLLEYGCRRPVRFD